ncbi:MAG: hypothetical protein JWO09_3311 [Bacteroidetes bacterium]|nr:hypothetical protein [Bacteroidota bacterium]
MTPDYVTKKMNYAILIGVSEYENAKNNLPGCRNDTFVVEEVLKACGKYDDILVLNTKINRNYTLEYC